MAHLSGKKISKKHSTVIDAAQKIISLLVNNPLVNRLSIGEIRVIGNGPKRIKIVHFPAGIKLTIRGRNSVQYFFIYTKKSQEVEKLINNFWNKKSNL